VESKSSLNTGLPVPHALRGWNDFARASLDFNWELDFWGKNRAATAAATSEADASRADAAAARLVISTAIAAAYADLARLYADRDVLASSLKVREETLTLGQPPRGGRLRLQRPSCARPRPVRPPPAPT
jgi:outer membrane protein TolC